VIALIAESLVRVIAPDLLAPRASLVHDAISRVEPTAGLAIRPSSVMAAAPHAATRLHSAQTANPAIVPMVIATQASTVTELVLAATPDGSALSATRLALVTTEVAMTGLSLCVLSCRRRLF